MASPEKIKRQTRELMKMLRRHGEVSINQKGDIRVSEGMSERLKNFIFSSPTVKIAILNELLGYESPHNPLNRSGS